VSIAALDTLNETAPHPVIKQRYFDSSCPAEVPQQPQQVIAPSVRFAAPWQLFDVRSGEERA
jgi:hypothetical protein